MSRADFSLPPAVEQMGVILRPRDAVPPILPVEMRQSIHQWLVEMSAAKDLERVGVKPRTRAIFGGPPGCGKTTMAHHIAARLGLPLFLVDSTSLLSKYMGETGQSIGKMFAALREQPGKVVLLLDEFDSMAAKRISQESSAAREQNNIVIALLQHVDRYTGMVIAATNRETDIDPAIWRRFDIQMHIGLPGGDERFAILKQYGAPFEFDEDALEVLTEATGGATPALLRGLMEGIKRNLVIAPRLSLPTDAASIIGRVAAALEPAEGLTRPLLWSGKYGPDIAGMPWPPVLPDSGAKEAA